MFGISKSVRSREVQVCTPELFQKAIKGSKVSLICAEIEDALEKLRRGELKKEEYERMKTQLKSQLPILTPHATFKNGRRLNADAIPSGLSIYDKDHIPNPRGYWEEKQKILAQKSVLDCICLVHVTPSTEGLRLIFKIPNGMPPRSQTVQKFSYHLITPVMGADFLLRGSFSAICVILHSCR